MIFFTGLLLATVAAFALGTLWYSPYLFGRIWMRLAGVEGKEKPGTVRMLLPLLAIFVTAYVLSMILASEGAYSGWQGAEGAFWAWLGLTIPFGFFQVIYERRSLVLLVIDQSYYLVMLMMMGAMLATW